MALTRQQKEQNVSEVAEHIQGATSVVFMAYDGLTVDEAEELRDTLFGEKSALRVVPKRLLKLALQKAKISFDPTELEGQVAIVWGADAVAPAKVLHTFSKTHESVRLVGGVLEGAVLSLEEVQALAQLPSREELLTQLVWVLTGPLRGFETVLTGAQRNLVYALSALAEQKQKNA